MNNSSAVPLPKRHRQSGDGLGVRARGSLCHNQPASQVSHAPDRLVHPGQQTSTAASCRTVGQHHSPPATRDADSTTDGASLSAGTVCTPTSITGRCIITPFAMPC